jgi:hypothetical protein
LPVWLSFRTRERPLPDAFRNTVALPGSGIYYSADGGKKWVLDVSTGAEMDACSSQPVNNGAQTQVWCIGYVQNGGNFSSLVYSTRVTTP